MTKTKYVNGIKAYYIAGVWYCDFKHYQQARMKEGIRASLDVFISWCDRYNLEPQG